MMIDTAKHPLLQRVYELCLAIEQCPAGLEQTQASTLASDLLNDLAKYYDTLSRHTKTDAGAQLVSPTSERKRGLILRG